MVRPGRERLSGIVEVDQAYVGEATRDSPGRKADQALVVLGVEVKDKSFGQARLRVVNSATLENITGFIKDHVEPGSTVITDGWKSYAGLKDNGYLHQIGKAIDDQEALRQVQRLIWLLKRWFLGTYQGAATKKYLDYYLDEYTFRFNRRKSGSCGQLFLALMEQVVVTGPVTCQALISPIGEAIGITLEDDEFGG
jgi:transposase-like protein